MLATNNNPDTDHQPFFYSIIKAYSSPRTSAPRSRVAPGAHSRFYNRHLKLT